MTRGRYNTRQKREILNIIKELNKEFTIKDIYDYFSGHIGLTTIYRMIEKLEKDGYIIKNIGKKNNTSYQYMEKCSEENHFYLKCDYCKQLIHIDCDCINALMNHINKKHQFVPARDKIIIHGLCDKCEVKNNEGSYN